MILVTAQPKLKCIVECVQQWQRLRGRQKATAREYPRVCHHLEERCCPFQCTFSFPKTTQHTKQRPTGTQETRLTTRTPDTPRAHLRAQSSGLEAKSEGRATFSGTRTRLYCMSVASRYVSMSKTTQNLRRDCTSLHASLGVFFIVYCLLRLRLAVAIRHHTPHATSNIYLWWILWTLDKPFESTFESSTDCGAASLCFTPWETPASSMARRLADYISN